MPATHYQYVSVYAVYTKTIKVAFRLKKPFSELRFPWGKTNIFSPPPPLPPLFSKMTAKVNSSFLKDILKLTALRGGSSEGRGGRARKKREIGRPKTYITCPFTRPHTHIKTTPKKMNDKRKPSRV